MNRRSFLKWLGIGVPAAVVATASAAVALPAILNPEAPKTTAYSTYIVGDDAILNWKQPPTDFPEPLTVADIRKCVAELKSRTRGL